MRFHVYLNKKAEAASLAVFRILFGLMMVLSIVRFWINGWIEKLYIEPTFFFSYYGFEWIKPLGDYTYVLFFLCGISALGVALGYKYRWSILVFFLSFTYIELMDKTTYLNHYYFISIISFLMIFLPASAYFSVDAKRRGAFQYVPAWSVDTIKWLLAMVYFYAGLSKLNSDWLVEAMPLKIWLPSKYDLPILGSFLHQEWLIYVFSWSGVLFDLSIPLLLFWKKTRTIAFVLVVIFHTLTGLLFPIGMFPFIMTLSVLLFFDAELHHKILGFISTLLRIKPTVWVKDQLGKSLIWKEKKPIYKKLTLGIVTVFITIQLLMPWRYLLYPGELFWTEEGFRFSWRVMLVEKAGYANFKIVTPKTGQRFYVNNTDFLTSFQEKQMSFQPDFILEYAHYLAHHFESQGHEKVEVYVENYVALNGRRSQPFIDSEINLVAQAESFKTKMWILPFKDEIKGL